MIWQLLMQPCLAQDLPDPAEWSSWPVSPLTAAEQLQWSERLEGAWKRSGYQVWDGGRYLEVAVRRDHIDETVESWLMRPDGTCRHLISAEFWKTGTCTLQGHLGEEEGLLLFTMSGIQRSIPGETPDERYALYWSAERPEIWIFLLGAEGQTRPPSQALQLLKTPYEER